MGFDGARGAAIKQKHIIALSSVFELFSILLSIDTGVQQPAQTRTTDIFWTLPRQKLTVKSLGDLEVLQLSLCVH